MSLPAPPSIVVADSAAAAGPGDNSQRNPLARASLGQSFTAQKTHSPLELQHHGKGQPVMEVLLRAPALREHGYLLQVDRCRARQRQGRSDRGPARRRCGHSERPGPLQGCREVWPRRREEVHLAGARCRARREEEGQAKDVGAGGSCGVGWGPGCGLHVQTIAPRCTPRSCPLSLSLSLSLSLAPLCLPLCALLSVPLALPHSLTHSLTHFLHLPLIP